MLYLVIRDLHSVTHSKITLKRSKKQQKVFKKGEQSKTHHPSGICCALFNSNFIFYICIAAIACSSYLLYFDTLATR